MKRLNIKLINYILISILFLNFFTGFQITQAIDISNFSTILIDEIGDYSSVGFNPDKIQDPIVYKQEVICEGHLPIILQFKSSAAQDLSGTLKTNFITKSEIGRKNIDAITYKYRILINESFSRQDPVYILKWFNDSVYYSKNDTWINTSKQRTVIDRYNTVWDYHYIWREIKDLSEIPIQKDNNIIIIDVQGNFKANLSHKEVDIVPTINIGDYQSTLNNYAWWSASWNYKKKITIDHNDVTGEAALTDFPICVRIQNDTDLFNHAQNDGDDIAFVNDDEDTQLKHEIEFYDYDEGNSDVSATIFVKIPSLAYDVDTEIYMYYGNAGAENQQDIVNTWNSAYVMVQHLNGDQDTTCLDSTSNNNDADADGGTPVYEGAGIAGSYGIGLDRASNEYLQIPDSASLDVTTQFTIEIWFNPAAASINTVTMLLSKHDDTAQTGYLVNYHSSNKFRVMTWNAAGADIDLYSLTTYTKTDVWVYCVAHQDASTLSVRGNASLVGSTTSGTASAGTKNLWIGRDVNGNTNTFEGYIDEVRISNTKRSSDWINTTYNTLKEHNTFLSLDIEISGNTPPEFSNPVPANASIGQNRPPLLELDVEDGQGDTMIVNWYSNSSGSWVLFAQNKSVTNQTIRQVNDNFSTSLTKYFWYCIGSDPTSANQSGIYHFTTAEGPLAPTNLAIELFNDVQFNLTWTPGVNTTHTRIQRKEGSYPTSISDGTNIYNNTGSSYANSGLTPATTYFYRAWGFNSTLKEWSASYDEVNATTLPAAPSSFTATGIDDGNISLSWTKGTGADNTIIRYQTGSYPLSTTNGSEAYNSTGTTQTVSGLDPGTTYYFRAWSHDEGTGFVSFSYADDTGTTGARPSDVTNLIVTSYNIEQLNLTWTPGNGSTTAIRRKEGSYPTSTADGDEVYNSTGTSYEDTGLNTSSHYYYSAWSFNELFSLNPAQNNNWTKPGTITNSTAKQYGGAVNISWNLSYSTGADNCVIRRKEGDYPENLTDGSQVYNGSLNYYNDTDYSNGLFYSLWGYNNSSKMYSAVHYLLWGGLTINCYDENTSNGLTFDIFVASFNGSSTWQNDDNTNPTSIDINLLPNGDKTHILISSEGYRSRSYYYDLSPNAQYVLNAYLPAEDDSELYLITVLNEFDIPVEDAKIIFKKSISGGAYTNVSVLYTDAYGQVNIYLLPDLYKVEISKDEYITKYADFIPNPAFYTKTFRLTHIIPVGEIEARIDEYITFNAYFNAGDNNTLHVNFSDGRGLTTDGRIYIYQNASDLKNLTIITGSYVNVTWAGANHSRYDYKILLEVYNHSWFGNFSRVVIIPVWSRSGFNIVNFELDLDGILGNFGEFQIGWINVLFFGLGIFILVSFGKYWAGGIGLIAVGLLLGLLELAFGLPGFTASQAAVIGFLVLLGILAEIRKAKLGVKI